MNISTGMPIQLPELKELKVPSGQAARASETFAERFKTVDKTSAEVPAKKLSNTADLKNVQTSDPVDVPEGENKTPVSEKVAGRSEAYDLSMAQGLTKDQAMQVFLDLMQKELNLDPEDVLQAFAKLDVDMLMAAPEESADKFLDNLELGPEDREKAEVLYSDLLTWRTAADLSEKLQGGGQHAQLKVLSKDELAKRERLEGLSNLSDRFFMMGDYSRSAKLAQTPKAVKAYGQFMDSPMAVQKAIVENPVAADAAQADILPIELPALEVTEPMAIMPQGPVATKPTGQIDITELGLEPVDLEAPDELMSKLNLQGQESNDFDQLGQSVMTNDQDRQQSGEDTSADIEVFGQQLGNKLERAESTRSFTVGAPAPTDLEMTENIREVIRGAQVMVKDGGGEMKINLAPEGMGELTFTDG